MHPSKRVAMSLLQNYILRNSIDRVLLPTLPGRVPRTLIQGQLLGGNGSSCFRQQECSIFTSLSTFNGSSKNGSARNEMSSSGETLPPEPPLDGESLSKLNDLKHGLQSKNEYFEKYKEKLVKLETTSPRELLARLEQLEDQKKDHVQRLKTADKVAKKDMSLNDIMHMDSLRNLDKNDIIHLWQEFHRHKEGVLGAVMAGAVFDKMKDLATVHNLFIMPLPRTDGYEFYFMQFENNTFHFTPLIIYQSQKEAAPVSLRLINYTELKGDKDLVLLRGEYDQKFLKAEDAHFLAVQTNFYYGETNESRLALLEKFTKTPDSFKHMDLIDELKRIQETHAQLFEFQPISEPATGSSG